MMRKMRMCVCLIGVLLLWATQAMAAERSTYVVTPFAVQGPEGFKYLERSIPQMLTTRLFWKGRVEPSVQDVPASQSAVSDDKGAERARTTYKADYVVWGSVTIIGDTYSLDVHVKDRSGKNWPFSHEGRTNQLMTAIRTVSDSINRQVFNRTVQAGGQSAERVNQMNAGIVINEDKPKDVYLNPQIRYAGSASDESRLRSQALAFNSVGMEVCDLDGDGKNEVVILGQNTLYAYRFEGTKLVPLGEFALPMAYTTLAVRSLPHPSGKSWIIVTMVDQKSSPQSSIFTFSNGNFTEIYSKIRYYLNVVKLPPNYRPVLIGQRSGSPRVFTPGVYEMSPASGELVPGNRLNLPEGANVFNFTYLPGGQGEDNAEKIIVLTDNEHLRTYSAKGARMAESDEKYSGASIGLTVDTTMPGLGKETVTLGGTYYIPMRMPAIDLEHEGKYKLLVNRPISTASTIFDRYRFFPQSEIHSLFWDGIGMSLQWKTRRIKGSTVDYTVADANNDGVTDLVVCINTHPGALGVQARRTVVMMYPLDMSAMDAATPTYKGDIND